MMENSQLECYRASMLLSGCGDALGYKNGRWEFCMDGTKIHEELEKLGGLQKINVSLPKWKLSDDTIMHIATAEAIIEKSCDPDREAFFLKIAGKYKECMQDMTGRAPGETCMGVSWHLKPTIPQGHHVPFNPRGGGCGAAMRAMCIGLRYPTPELVDDLITVSIEAGRMTHHHPTGYLGALASALFTSFAIQGKPVKSWGKGLMDILGKAKEYIKSSDRYVKENIESWGYFTLRWQDYLKLRGIKGGEDEPKFPVNYDIVERDAFYNSLSWGGWGGASGHDAPMIAYDALLAAGNDWDKLCKHGMFHCGDSDSTGVIAGACFGALYGFSNVPVNNYKHLEYRDRIDKIAIELYKLSHPDEKLDESDISTHHFPDVPQDASAPTELGVSPEEIQLQVPGQSDGRESEPTGAANILPDTSQPDTMDTGLLDSSAECTPRLQKEHCDTSTTKEDLACSPTTTEQHTPMEHESEISEERRTGDSIATEEISQQASDTDTPAKISVDHTGSAVPTEIEGPSVTPGHTPHIQKGLDEQAKDLASKTSKDCGDVEKRN